MEIYTVKEASKKLNVCVKTLYNYINEEGLTSSKPRGRRFFTDKDIEAFLNKGRA
ncbi:DNA binding domain, excisionase family [Bacteroidales bacterium Barb6XT]|nr:DNA binding domain, excisionase family [Bacteroidales bacterium Barb6XT]OAV70697.1 DNA binding domain, excisionase family [Bacteroidales bacterium Barb4]